MIDGVKLDFTTTELSEHLAVRIKYHAERGQWYKQQASALRAGGAQPQQYTNGDPIQSLDTSYKQHQHRAELLSVIQTHLVAGEVYRLDESDLSKLELISSANRW